jgi:hypothetical protein
MHISEKIFISNDFLSVEYEISKRDIFIFLSLFVSGLRLLHQTENEEKC